MKYRSLILFALAMACGKPKNNNDSTVTPTAKPLGEQPTSFLLQVDTNKVFLDTSSELRCDALKEFYAQFAIDALENGEVESFECEDLSTTRDKYFVKVQLTSADRTAYIEQKISWDLVSPAKYCNKSFAENDGRTCSDRALYFKSDGSSIQPTEGMIHPNMSFIKDFVSAYVNQPQTRDLSFGMDSKDFATKWIVKFGRGEPLMTNDQDGSAELWLQMTPGNDGGSGTVKIADVKSEALDNGKILFGCQDKICLLGQDYPYIFNGHHLVLDKSYEGVGLRLSITLNNP